MCAWYGPTANCRLWRAVSRLPAGKTNYPPRRSSLSVRGSCGPIGRGIYVAPRALPNYNNVHSMPGVSSVTKAKVSAGLHLGLERRRRVRSVSVKRLQRSKYHPRCTTAWRELQSGIFVKLLMTAIFNFHNHDYNTVCFHKLLSHNY